MEGGYGERLPSIDTRPPRVRDSDAIIEVFEDLVIKHIWLSDNPFYGASHLYMTTYFCEQIVLQDTEDDDSSGGIGVQDQPEGGEPQREDSREDHVADDEIPSLEPEYSDEIPQDYNGRKKELAGRRKPFMNSISSNIPNEDEDLSPPQEDPIEYSDSRGQNPRSYGGKFSSSHEERY